MVSTRGSPSRLVRSARPCQKKSRHIQRGPLIHRQGQSTYTPPAEGVYWVAISNDGAWAASGGLASPGSGFISAYSATSGATARKFY
jgi:hypothetical protein